MCVIFYLYTATCGPKGYGSGLPLPSRTVAGSLYITLLYPGPNRQPSVLVGYPFLLFPNPPDKREREIKRQGSGGVGEGDAEEGDGKWRSWWRACRRRERGGSGGVGGGDAEEGEEEVVVEEGCNIWRWRRCGSREGTVIECLFVFFYLYPVAWGPKGHGSGFTAAPNVVDREVNQT